MIAAYINRLAMDARAGGDLLEQLDAGEECEHGRLPDDRTPECGCWGPALHLVAHRPERLLTDEQVALAHRWHMLGESVASLGRRLWHDAGYRSAHTCAEALRAAFHASDLPVRPRREAAVKTNTSTGTFARQANGVQGGDAYNLWRRRQRADKPRCHGLRVDGTRCAFRAKDGHHMCGRHMKPVGQLRLVAVDEQGEPSRVLGVAA